MLSEGTFQFRLSALVAYRYVAREARASLEIESGHPTGTVRQVCTIRYIFIQSLKLPARMFHDDPRVVELQTENSGRLKNNDEMM